MKINGDRSSAGIPLEKNDKSGRITSKSSASETTRPVETGDELELTSKTSAIFNALRESKNESPKPLADDLASIRSRLAAVTNSILANPAEALSAQGNISSETVAQLVG